MNVLSLFDGMSCGQIALDQLGLRVDNYYASEIDKWAIQITQKNYHNTQQLGDITKWREWDIDWSGIDLVFGGSPCQGFSLAGKQLAFDDPRSKLFFVFVDIVNHIKEHNPDVKFMLENVRMKKEYLDIITEYMGVEPVKINSALVSAQNRVRYYWTNIGIINQPKDRFLYLKDIIEDGHVDREKSLAITTRVAGATVKDYLEKHRHQMVMVGYADFKGHDSTRRIYSIEGKAPTLTTMGGGHREPKIAVREATKKGYAEATVGDFVDLTYPNSKTRRGGVGKNGKSNTITAGLGEAGVILPGLIWRKLTPLECERLQTVPDGYTEGVSNTQRYRMLGNGWTVEVIKHIFANLGDNANED